LSNNLIKFFILIAYFISFSSDLSAQNIIKKILFNGLERTSIEHLDQYLKCAVGDTLDPEVLQDDETFLRNSQFFSNASHSISIENNNATVTFNVSEKRTLLPILSFNVIKSNYFIQAGAVEYNLFGNWNQLGGYYQYYDRSSYSIFSEFNNILKSRIGIIGRYNKISTTEPAYFENGTTFFDVDKYSAEIIFTYDLSEYLLRNPKIQFGIGANYLEEDYNKNLEKSGNISHGPDYDNRKKIILKSTLSISSIDYYYEHLDGFSFKTYYDVVSEKDDVFGFHQILGELKFFQNFHNKFNAASRLRVGFSTNKFSPFIPFLIDNYINVRGAGDRAARGSAELSLNLELRSTIFRNSWTALQMVNFIDYGSIRPGGKKLNTIFDSENIYSSAGIGLRIHLLNFFNAIFRLDYGVKLHENANGFVAFGLGQYF
jgi:hypothetical protein